VTYTVLAAIAVAATVAIDLAGTRIRLITRRAFWVAYAIILAFQLVVNGLLTGLPVVRYRPGDIIGWRLVYAPVEDLLFGFCLVLLTLTGWVWLGRRAAHAQTNSRPATQARRPMPTEARRDSTS
jgi:lycopene cyclase domain-containing protein